MKHLSAPPDSEQSTCWAQEALLRQVSFHCCVTNRRPLTSVTRQFVIVSRFGWVRGPDAEKLRLPPHKLRSGVLATEAPACLWDYQTRGREPGALQATAQGHLAESEASMEDAEGQADRARVLTTPSMTLGHTVPNVCSWTFELHEPVGST